MDDEAKAGGAIGPGMGGFFAGIMIGAAVAGIAALLYAPRPGKETRDRLRAELQETQNMFQCWSDDIKTRMESFSQVLRSFVEKEAQPTGDGQKPSD
jgi:gas vesicle protein